MATCLVPPDLPAACPMITEKVQKVSGAAFFQKGGVLSKLFEKSFTKNFFVFQ
ncbi:hypothetical protein ACU81Q_00280 [Komagataeibacter melomenusus]